MKREILKMGHPVLRQKAQVYPLEKIGSEEFQTLMIDMYDSMLATGGIGLAAPQIGLSYQIAIIELKADQNRYGAVEEVPFSVYINPEIEVLTDEKEGNWEGCLSVPGLRGYVERPNKIRVTFYNEKADKQVKIFENFPAVVVQHELDHLSGTLYIDKLKDPTMFCYQEEFHHFQPADQE